MKVKTNIRAGIAWPPPVSRCVGIGGGGGGGGNPNPNPSPVPESVV